MEIGMGRLFFACTSLAAVLTAFSIGSAPIMAQDAFPTRPIRIINPLPAESAPDVIVRLIAQQLTNSLGQQVIVENRPGGSNINRRTGCGCCCADGYTLLGGATSIFTILPAGKGRIPVDVIHDFTQIGSSERGSVRRRRCQLCVSEASSPV
jgi:tripartite-type tricarboxylate transporter receptor subunit TctC